MTTTAALAATGPEIREPTLTQQLMLDAPFGDDLCVISARGTGKSWGGRAMRRAQLPQPRH